jgi:AraC family transcriptional regulator
LAKIALELERALAERAASGSRGGISPRVLAQGGGWSVSDVVCTSGPQDRPFEEEHSSFTIAMVVAGTFQYRAAAGRELMTPGSILLGQAGRGFECSHEHGAGDRCIAFRYEPSYFETLAGEAGRGYGKLEFSGLRIPPLRETSPLLAQACVGITGNRNVDWEEISLQLAAQTVQLLAGISPQMKNPVPSSLARVTRAVRTIEQHLDEEVTVGNLARKAGLSPYHFLRTFVGLTGVTPHQYVMRMRLRQAATLLAAGRSKILDVALDCGFRDVSNFNHAFRAEFGVNPRAYREQRTCG